MIGLRHTAVVRINHISHTYITMFL